MKWRRKDTQDKMFKTKQKNKETWKENEIMKNLDKMSRNTPISGFTHENFTNRREMHFYRSPDGFTRMLREFRVDNAMTRRAKCVFAQIARSTHTENVHMNFGGYSPSLCPDSLWNLCHACHFILVNGVYFALIWKIDVNNVIVCIMKMCQKVIMSFARYSFRIFFHFPRPPRELCGLRDRKMREKR